MYVVCLLIVSFCQSDDTLLLLGKRFFTSVFCVRTGNRAKDSRTTDHTRNGWAKPYAAAASSEFCVSTGPLPLVPRSQKVPHDLFLLLLCFLFLSNVCVLIVYRLCTDAVPKRKHTSGYRLRVLIHQFLTNYNTI